MPSDIHSSHVRDYRTASEPGKGETAFQVVLEQSDLYVVAKQDLSAQILEYLGELRAELKNHIALNPEFVSSLTPLDPTPRMPELARRMCLAGCKCGVGPMAAVAGSIAQAVAERFVGQSPELIVENGGDIFLCSSKPRVVGLLSRPIEGMRLGLRLKPKDFPLSLCASSAKIGHSLSFGQADLITVRAKDGALADAAATALANLARSPEHLELVMARAQELARHGVEGVFAHCGGKIAVWGRMELVALE